MTSYIKIESQHLGDPRWLEAGPDAFTLHIWALVHCNQQLTDGRISKTAAERIALPVPIEDTKPAIEALLKAGLWSDDGEQYVIEDYFSHALEAVEIRATRKRWADDKRWRRKHQVGNHSECPPDKCRMSQSDIGGSLNGTSAMSRPLDQTRPDQTPKGSGSGRGPGTDFAGAPSALPARKEGECLHRVNGLTWTNEGRLRCEACHRLAHQCGGISLTTEVLLNKAKTWPEYTDAEEAAIRSADPNGFQMACELAGVVYRRSFPDQDPDQWDLDCDPLIALIFHNINPEQAKRHEYIDDKGDCKRCNLPERNPVHVQSEVA